MKISAIIVLYNPSEILSKCIEAIINQVDKVFLVDNSNYRQDGFTDNSKITYVPLNENRGIANALNVGFELSIKWRAAWVICLDQDSIVPSDIIVHFNSIVENDESIGMVGPNYKKNEDDIVRECDSVENVDSIITSGSFVRVNAYVSVGGFKDLLFIDSVDTEFSWNLITNKWRILQVNSVVMEHNLGHDAYDIKIFGHRLITVTNHNRIRCYYIARNSLYVGHLYKSKLPKYAKPYCNKWLKHLIKVILFEEDKIMKCLSIYNGVKDYCNNRMGKVI